MMKQLFSELKPLLLEVRRLATRSFVLAALGLVLGLGLLGFWLDDWAYRLVEDAGSGPAEFWAEKLSFFGDFLPGTLPLAVGLWLIGWVGKNPRWRVAAVACLTAAILSGALVSTLRLSAGRTRPDATMESAIARLGHEPRPILSLGHLLPDGKLVDGFYGFQRPAMFQGFPSGHSATSVATATALFVALPEVGVVLSPVALGVCWSRLYLHKHHLSDVLVGAAVGLIGGLLLGLAARKVENGIQTS